MSAAPMPTSAGKQSYDVANIEYLIQKGQVQEAHSVILQELRQNPESAWALAQCAALALVMNQTQPLEGMLKQLGSIPARAENLPARARGWIVAGDWARRQKKPAEAFYKRVLREQNRLQPYAFVVCLAHAGMARLALLKDDNDNAYRHGEAAIAAMPEWGEGYYVRGVSLGGLGQHEAALADFSRAIKLGSQSAAVLNAYGSALSKLKRVDEALKAWEIARKIAPNNAMLHNNIGFALYQLHRFDEARDSFATCLKVSPKDAVAAHMFASLSGNAAPDKASADYVKITFDAFADTFDAKLGNLGYRAPQLLHQALQEYWGEPDAHKRDIVDAGCGTGLCADFLKPYANKLVGVDLSPEMLKKAAKRHKYDRLEAAELVSWLFQAPASYDAIVAADVLVYFGDLGDFFAKSALSLRSGGWLAFTTESSADAAWQLGPHGRYAHSYNYLAELAEKNGFELVQIRPDILRQEGGKPVEGFVALFSKI